MRGRAADSSRTRKFAVGSGDDLLPAEGRDALSQLERWAIGRSASSEAN